MKTIKKGSTGEDVKRWQSIINVTVDGDFGPQTEEATKVWQKKNKLVPDGVVGPLTWSAATGEKVQKFQKNSTAPTDEWAKAVMANVPGYNESQKQYALSVARGEGFYGRGWGKTKESKLLAGPELEKNNVLAKTSNNWGAVQGKGDANPPSFLTIDHDAAGKPYVWHYRRYSTPEKGAADMMHILFNGGKRGATGAAALNTALKKGDLKTAVFEQRKNGYYELAPDQYYSHMLKNYGQLTANLDWKALFDKPFNLTKTVFITVLSLLGLGAVAGATKYGLSRRN
jgi:hypothetical protein